MKRMPFFRIAFCMLGLIVMCCGFSWLAYHHGFWRFNYPGKEKYPVRGLDVSHHQGHIDWALVPKEEFSFVYIKATEGGDFKDPDFARNWKAARENNFKTGAYHFFTLCRGGADQAKNFIESIPPVKAMLPVAVDLEFAGNCRKRPAREEFAAELKAFVSQVEMHYAEKPVFYTTPAFHREYLKDAGFDDYSLWVRSIFKEPASGEFPAWLMWQYADNARIPGIEAPVDLNILHRR